MGMDSKEYTFRFDFEVFNKQVWEYIDKIQEYFGKINFYNNQQNTKFYLIIEGNDLEEKISCFEKFLNSKNIKHKYSINTKNL
jgi:hypothetical protein